MFQAPKSHQDGQLGSLAARNFPDTHSGVGEFRRPAGTLGGAAPGRPARPRSPRAPAAPHDTDEADVMELAIRRRSGIGVVAFAAGAVR